MTAAHAAQFSISSLVVVFRAKLKKCSPMESFRMEFKEMMITELGGGKDFPKKYFTFARAELVDGQSSCWVVATQPSNFRRCQG